MNFVCKDVNGTEWKEDYCIYYRFDKNSNIIAKILGKYIPNPDILWNKRCVFSNSPLGSEEVNGIRLKPTEAVFKLWEHYNNVKPNH